MKQASEVVKSEPVSIRVREDSREEVSGVDRERLAAALADHRKAVDDLEARRLELTNLRKRINEVGSEIANLEQSIMVKPNMSGMSIDQIKFYADRMLVTQNQVNALVDVQTGLEMTARDMLDERYSMLTISGAKDAIWYCIYEGLLSAIDKDALEQLLAAGAMVNKSERNVLLDLSMTADYRRIEKIIKEFGLPE